jgi:hypothetical protein
MAQTNSWRELHAAARELGITPEQLLELEKQKVWVHVAKFGSSQLVARHSIDALKNWLVKNRPTDYGNAAQ